MPSAVQINPVAGNTIEFVRIMKQEQAEGFGRDTTEYVVNLCLVSYCQSVDRDSRSSNRKINRASVQFFDSCPAEKVEVAPEGGVPVAPNCEGGRQVGQ